MSGDLLRQPSLEAILRPGQVVGGRYCVDKLMAEGGMAAVWAGVNQRTGKRVALKVILRSFASNDEAAELFRREALAASKVNHPNVVSIFDVIDHEAMTCIVMELLDGETLDLYLARNGPLSLQETVALLLPAMRGVAAANAQGVVHRDLKPGNIFLCSGPDGRLLTTKVLDFGIATMTGRAGEPSTADLLVRLGTPAYMSPEAIQCSPNIDGRADVYGFGVLIFEALTGKLPFPGEPGPELFMRILTDPAPKVTEFRPDLPVEVVTILDRALAKDANERYPDMEHFIRAVEDNLLPPLPRALTPMHGMFLSQPLESTSSSAIATPGAVSKKEPSGRVHQGETKVLFSLPGLPEHGQRRKHRTAKTSLVLRKRLLQATIVNHLQRLLTYLTGFGRLLRRRTHRRTAVGAGIAVVLVATACLAVAARPSRRGMDKRQSSSSSHLAPSAHGPQITITPLPSTPTPTPLPAPIASSPFGSSEGSEDVQESLQPVPTLPRRTLPPVRTATNTVPPSVRPQPLSSRRVSPHDASAHRPRTAASPDLLSAPRAGTLSATDFF